MIKSVKDLKAYEDVFTLIDECTDNYVFVYDLENDLFHISKSALDTFTLEEISFQRFETSGLSKRLGQAGC